ncbi:hypothetical protein [Flavobacterium sp.]|uniref:hypothetical protein n=1 Tax=Flavobacterium sp. TaxID=239 RepID=UPI0039E52CCF
MKKLLLFVSLLGLTVSAQTIQKKDGSKVDVSGGTIHVEPGNKRLTYFLKDSKKAAHIKFKNFDQATWDDFIFKTFVIDGKTKGYYVVAESEGKTLASSKRTRIKSRGGFESTYNLYQVAVLDQQNKVIEELIFTDENTDKKSAERAAVLPLIKKHFAGCPKLIERASAFESPSGETKNRTILVFLDTPTYVKCQ